MAKSQTGDATNKSNSIYNQSQQQLAPVQSGLRSSQSGTQGQAVSGLTQQQTTGGYDPGQLTGLRSTGAQFTQTGGYDPTQLSKITGGYQNFADTGGYTPDQANQFLNQATSGVTGTYNVLADQLKNNTAAQGGRQTGEMSQLARNLGQDQANATLAAQTNLNQQINQNKLAGLGGLASTNADVAAGRRGAFGQQIGLESGVASGVQGANQTLGNMSLAQMNQLLSSYGLQFGTQQDAINALTQLSRNPGLFGNIMQGISTISAPVSLTGKI